jgi:hypothetical protein
MQRDYSVSAYGRLIQESEFMTMLAERVGYKGVATNPAFRLCFFNHSPAGLTALDI